MSHFCVTILCSDTYGENVQCLGDCAFSVNYECCGYIYAVVMFSLCGVCLCAHGIKCLLSADIHYTFLAILLNRRTSRHTSRDVNLMICHKFETINNNYIFGLKKGVMSLLVRDKL